MASLALSVTVTGLLCHDASMPLAVVAGGARRDSNSIYRQVGPVDFFPTSYLYDPTGEIVMFIPGQVREGKLKSFMEDWNREHGRARK